MHTQQKGKLSTVFTENIIVRPFCLAVYFHRANSVFHIRYFMIFMLSLSLFFN
jgi:hypothetical protein